MSVNTRCAIAIPLMISKYSYLIDHYDINTIYDTINKKIYEAVNLGENKWSYDMHCNKVDIYIYTIICILKECKKLNKYNKISEDVYKTLNEKFINNFLD